jgi:hypothetical protein
MDRDGVAVFTGKFLPRSFCDRRIGEQVVANGTLLHSVGAKEGNDAGKRSPMSNPAAKLTQNAKWPIC